METAASLGTREGLGRSLGFDLGYKLCEQLLLGVEPDELLTADYRVGVGPRLVLGVEVLLGALSLAIMCLIARRKLLICLARLTNEELSSWLV